MSAEAETWREMPQRDDLRALAEQRGVEVKLHLELAERSGTKPRSASAWVSWPENMAAKCIRRRPRAMAALPA